MNFLTQLFRPCRAVAHRAKAGRRTGVLALLLALAAGPAARALDLATYRESDVIVLGTVAVEVQPVRFQKIKSPLGGKLFLHLPATGRQLEAGAVWAEFEPDRIKLEREAVTLARQLLNEKDQPGFRLEQSRARTALVNALEEIRRQSALLDKIAREPELAKLYLADEGRAGAGGPEAIAEMRARLDRQAQVLDSVLGYVGTARQEELELRALELKLRQQELEQAQREDESRLTMPFAGEVTLYPAAPPAGEPLRVQTGADLALLQDFSRLNVRVPLKRAEWRLVETGRLLVQFRPGGGTRAPLSATFLRSLTEDVFGREELVYYFQFPAEQGVAARPLVGGQVSAQLLATLETRARLVPKLDLVLADPAAFREAGWVAGVAKVLPGARVLLVGETELAIVPAAAPAK